MKKKTIFILIVVFQIVVLTFITGSYYAVDFFGKEITLEAEPVDPRDIFYGDYVILRYEIQTLDRSLWKGEGQPDEEQRLFVKLEPDGEFYSATGLFAEKPDTSGDEVVLEAELRHDRSNEYFVEYGLERYYVPEGTGGRLEEQREGMTVDIRVAPWGQAKIKELHVKEG